MAVRSQSSRQSLRRASATDCLKSPKTAGRFLALVCSLLIGLSACSSGGSVELATGAEMFDAGGAPTTLGEFEGSPVVLNFFAAWCAPCRAEMPDFDAVSIERGDQIQFVGVSRDYQEEAWLEFVDATGVTFPTFFQPSEELFLSTGGLAMPTTVFIDADGNSKFVHSGPLSASRLNELIDEHLVSG